MYMQRSLELARPSPSRTLSKAKIILSLCFASLADDALILTATNPGFGVNVVQPNDFFI